jgi:galactokinase
MNTFVEVFGRDAEATGHAPGRVNLLGEHTDYNDGFVLPTTIPQQTVVNVAHATGSEFEFYSANLQQRTSCASTGPVPQGFAAYVYGCIDVLRKHSLSVPPLSIFIHSEVPIGSGLSSSAGLEVAVLRALRSLLKYDFDDVQLALWAQRAEIEYAGVNCGILDQMACSLGQADHALFLDTRTLERRLLPFPEGSTIAIIDSGVPRELSNSAYNRRREECHEAAQLLGVQALRDVTDVERIAALPDPLQRRARHVITENARVLTAARGIDAQQFGTLMNQSHASLRDDFEVSIPALDRLVDILQAQPGVYGARLTGAGFGGACVALLETSAATRTKQNVMRAYERAGFSGKVVV